MKMRTSSIWAAVEMKSNAVGLTVVVRPSRMAVSAAGRTGHSSRRPTTLIQAVMSRFASTSAAPRAQPRRAGVALLDERASQCDDAAMDLAIGDLKSIERGDQLLHHEQADVMVKHRPTHFERRHEVVIDQERVGRERVDGAAASTTGNPPWRRRVGRGPIFQPQIADAAAASDASWGVNGRDWTEHPAISVFARNASSRPRAT